MRRPRSSTTSFPVMYPFCALYFAPTFGSIFAVPPVIALCCSDESQARYSVVGAVGIVVRSRRPSVFIDASVIRALHRDLNCGVGREGVEPPVPLKILFYRQARPTDIRVRPRYCVA